MTDYLLGVDGGGSKTVALLGDGQGRVLGRGTAGTSNYQVAGVGAAVAALEAAIAGAFAAAGVPVERPRALVLGLAGVDRPEDRAVFDAWLTASRPAGATAIVNDAEIVLAAGSPAGWGVALICGTGSIAYGKDPHGRPARAGGWGHLLGDEGSGYAVGLAALRAVARAADGRGPATALTGLILEHWSLAAPAGLFQRVYQENVETADIAALAPLVEQAAAADPVAGAILNDAGHELALAVAAVVRQLGLEGPVPCAQAGGLLVHGKRIARAVLNAAGDLGLSLAPVTPVSEPARGALRLARNLR